MRTLVYRLQGALYGTNKKLNTLRKQQWYSKEKLNSLINRRLSQLLKYAYENVPYYREILLDSGVVDTDRHVNLSCFKKIPMIDKESIRDNFDNLKSSSIQKRKWIYRRTGGSTGVPLTVIFDSERASWIKAVKGLRCDWCGFKPGQPKVTLSGSERDMLLGKEAWKTKALKWIGNNTFLDTFCLSHEKMVQYVWVINRIRPDHIKAFTSSIYEFAKFIKREGRSIHSPGSIICSAGTLTPMMRNTIEEVFNAPTFNSYGSREIQAHAFECQAHSGLHVMSPTIFFEILRKDGSDAKPGEVGDIVITPFFNYAMPLLRYKIGDMASWARNPCSCGRAWPLLENISGRKIECFLRKDGGVVPPEYFSRIFGVTIIGDWIEKFQIVQENLGLISVFIVSYDSDSNLYDKYKESIDSLKAQIRHVMSDHCTIDFHFVDSIPSLKSGKFLNTISKINNE